MNPTEIINELRRRRVFRGAGLYLVGAWIALQLGDVIVEPLGLPLSVMTLVLYLAILGFPVALLLAWRYQWTEHGLVRSQPEDADNDGADLKLSAMDYGIFALLVLLIAGALFQLAPEPETLTTASAEGETPQSLNTTPVTKQILPNSIAVLPFADMSPAQDQEYFADGLSDTLLHVLAQVHSLKVAARTSSFAFKGRNEDISSIAAQLGVANVLEGSVQKSGTRLRVIAQLIEARHGTHLWSMTFDGDLGEIFEFQDEIAARVVDAMQIALVESDASRLSQRYRPNIQAYDQMVLGRFAMGKATAAELTTAAGHFRTAIQLDPNYALPHVYLANALRLIEIYALGIQDTFSYLSTQATREQQQSLISEALRLDPLSGEAIAVQASIEPDEAEAEKLFLKALRLNSNYAPAYLWYSRFLSIRQGRYAEALTQLEHAVALDPLSDIIQFEYVKMIWATGRAEEAVSRMLDNVRRNPNYPPYYKRMTRWQAHLGDMGRAGLWVKALRKLDPDSPSHWGEWGGECWVLARLRDVAASEKCLTEFIEAHPDTVAARRMMADRLDAIADAGRRPTLKHTIKILAEMVSEEPGNDYRANQLASAFEIAGEYEEALKVMRVAHPQLFTETPIVSGETTWPATLSANALLRLGRTDEANKIINSTSDAVAGMRLIAGPGFTTGIENVELASLKGDKEEALRLFKQAVDHRWRFMWDFTPFMQTLETIQSDERFTALYEQMEADIEKQREWFHANQNLPLY